MLDRGVRLFRFSVDWICVSTKFPSLKVSTHFKVRTIFLWHVFIQAEESNERKIIMPSYDAKLAVYHEESSCRHQSLLFLSVVWASENIEVSPA
jgi:hypothetical protein